MILGLGLKANFLALGLGVATQGLGLAVPGLGLVPYGLVNITASASPLSTLYLYCSSCCFLLLSLMIIGTVLFSSGCCYVECCQEV